MDTDAYKIYNLIKISVCKYLVAPLTCTKEDTIVLSNEIAKRVTNNNYDYKEWYHLFNKYLKINSQAELNNVISYVKNHI